LTRSQPLEQGKLFGVTFLFENVGDGLPLHSHPEGEAHITLVRSGRLRILRPDGKHEEVGPGAFKCFAPDELHGYEALEPCSKITNIIY